MNYNYIKETEDGVINARLCYDIVSSAWYIAFENVVNKNCKFEKLSEAKEYLLANGYKEKN